MCTMWVSEKWLHRFSTKLVAATLAVVGLVVFCAVNFTSCTRDPAFATNEHARHAVVSIQFFKYPGTDICFATQSLAILSDAFNAATMTYVPCEKIPAGKLVSVDCEKQDAPAPQVTSDDGAVNTKIGLQKSAGCIINDTTVWQFAESSTCFTVSCEDNYKRSGKHVSIRRVACDGVPKDIQRHVVIVEDVVFAAEDIATEVQ